jgi:hypothetical protein
MDVETLARGIEILEACTREKGGCSTRGTLAGLNPGGSCPPTMTLALDVIIQSLDVIIHNLDVTQLRYPVTSVMSPVWDIIKVQGFMMTRVARWVL